MVRLRSPEHGPESGGGTSKLVLGVVGFAMLGRLVSPDIKEPVDAALDVIVPAAIDVAESVAEAAEQILSDPEPATLETLFPDAPRRYGPGSGVDGLIGFFPVRTGYDEGPESETEEKDHAMLYLKQIQELLQPLENFEVIVQFGDKNNSDIAAYQAGWACRTAAGEVQLAYSMPVTFGDKGGNTAASAIEGNSDNPLKNGIIVGHNLDLTAEAGVYDMAFKKAAENLVAGGCADAIIRLGWEFDGAHSSSSVWETAATKDNAEKFKKAYIRAHRIMMSVPGAKFRFDFNGMKNDENMQWWDAAYPGDEYVDIVGLDIYDRGFGCESNDQYVPHVSNWRDPEECWRRAEVQLRKHLDFAVKHGKQVSFPEWGVQVRKDKGDAEPTVNSFGGDNPRFIRGMMEWMRSLPKEGPGSLAYSTYFWTRAWRLDNPELAKSLEEMQRQVNGMAVGGIALAIQNGSRRNRAQRRKDRQSVHARNYEDLQPASGARQSLGGNGMYRRSEASLAIPVPKRNTVRSNQAMPPVLRNQVLPPSDKRYYN